MCSKTPSTPQKQPPASTAVCVSAGLAGAASVSPAKNSCHVKIRRVSDRISGSSWNKTERNRIHAVTQTGRLRAVVENMAQMRGAARAADFLPAHAGRLALALRDVV